MDFYRLRNEEWFQLFTEFRDLVLKYNPGALNIAELWATFLILYADADTALEIIRKSADTVLMIEADHVRDHCRKQIEENPPLGVASSFTTAQDRRS